MDRLIGIVTRISEWLDLILEWLAKRSTPLEPEGPEGRSLEEVVGRIEKSAARLADAVKEERSAAEEGNEEPGGGPGGQHEPAAPAPRRNEWWDGLAREDWNLIHLSWELRGVILRTRSPVQEAPEGKKKGRNPCGSCPFR